jgi:exonuclease III
VRIAKWNVNDLQSNKEEIKLFQNQNFIDILQISETYFIDKNSLQYKNSSFTTQIILMAHRTAVRRYL